MEAILLEEMGNDKRAETPTAPAWHRQAGCLQKQNDPSH
jgi:hypothetical protein